MLRSLTLAAVATLLLFSGTADAARRRKPNISLGQVLDALNLIPSPKKLEESLNQVRSKPLLKDMSCG